MKLVSTSDASRRVLRVWKRLGDWYGVRLADAYGKTPPQDWCELIDSLDIATIKRALSIVRSEHLHHPPTLGEFEAAAKPPAPRATAPSGPSVTARLTEYVLAHYPLTAQQIRQPWTWLSRQSTVLVRGQPQLAVEIVGVVVPADPDGARQRFRCLVEDMEGDALPPPPNPQLEMVP